MFDLDLIEQDYLKNSFCLTEEEIIEIYEKEGATLKIFYKELDECQQKRREIINKYGLSGLERMFLNDDNEYGRKLRKRVEYADKLLSKYEYPEYKHLSEKSKKIVIEGSLFIVFKATREWYNFFKGNIAMEKLYYICLEALFSSVKYLKHSGDPVFKLYVLKSIEQRMIKYYAKINRITYREAYNIINKTNYEEEFCWERKKRELIFPKENEEISEKPAQINYRLRNEVTEVDYLEYLTTEECLIEYNKALNNLSEEEKRVMKLSYDSNGYKGLTYAEISDYLGLDIGKVENIKKRAIRKLRKNQELTKYINY